MNIPHQEVLKMSSLNLFLAVLVVVGAAEEKRVLDDCPAIISREEWNATKPSSVRKLAENPAPYIVVHHSATPFCNSTENCTRQVQSIQRYHMVDQKWEDIGYNFLIGGNGTIFEGRGWGIHGAHSVEYNRKSVGICLLGNFMDVIPNEVQLKALKDLIRCAETTKRVKEDYKIVGHRQVRATLCPGDKLFDIIKTWDHFEEHPE